MPSFLISAGIGLRRGAAKGWRGFVWMLKIILPVSLLTFLLDFSGCLTHLDGLLEPLMGVVHLPAMAALPLLAGLLTGIYGGIAAMTVLPFTVQQMTLMAVFLLIAHSLIQEGLVQHHSGCPMWMATANRLVAAVLTVFAMGWLLGPETAQKTAGMMPGATTTAFWPAFQAWGMAMAGLGVKMLLVIVGLMVVMELAKQVHLVEKVVRLIEPLLGLLGLSRQVGLLWLTAALLGITYGGALIVEEVREGKLPPDRLKTLHVSIGINHAMLEDPAVFIPLGIHPFWLWVPRLVVAVMFAHAYRLWLWMRTRRRSLAVNAVSAGSLKS
jgi:hypothetical protein